MTGLEHIQQTFSACRKDNRAALMPYFTCGYPDLETSFEILQSIAHNGADLIELGIPFSDPLADGPTIQHSTQAALNQGVRVADSLQMAARLRKAGVEQPILLMGYLNPLLAYGSEMFIRAAAEAGVDGLIVPDLPLEESDEIEAQCRAVGLALIYFLAPTSTPERIKAVADRANGFVYLVSVTGVTGARSALPEGIEAFVTAVKREVKTPIALGFGISSPELAHQAGRLADGVIAGSAVISRVDGAADPARAVGEFVRELREGMNG